MSHVDDGALHAYLDGELTPVERARLEAHVAECPACRGRLDEERALIERASQLLGLAQPPERAAPPPLHQLRQPRLVWRLRVPLAWAATIVLAVGLGYYAGGMRLARAPLADSSHTLTATPRADSLIPVDRLGFANRSVDTPPRRAATKPPANVADEPAANALADSVAPVAGVVAIQPGAAVRPATPAPVPSAQVTTSRSEVEVAAARGRLVATEWPIIRRDPARQLLGADPVGIPGLAVRGIRRSPAGEVVLVEQQLDSTTVIQLFQERAEPLAAAPRTLARERVAQPTGAAAVSLREYAGTERLARFIGSLRVEIAGPLTPDSLNKLLEQLKPIP